MSVEIEVGLENAARVPVDRIDLPLEEPPKKGLANPKVLRALTGGSALLVVGLAALYLFYRNRETTDDAQVDGHVTPIAAKIGGRVGAVLVNDNQPVKVGQVLVKIDPRDYQAAVDQAKATLAFAESEARSAGVDV